MTTNTLRDAPRSTGLTLGRLRWLPYLLLVLAGAWFVLGLWQNMSDSFANDFSVNWTAARGWQQGISLYDMQSQHKLGLSLIADPAMRVMFTERFTSFDNPPTTALLLWPFALFPFATALALYRVAATLGFIVAIWLTGLALPQAYRQQAWFVGLLGFFLLRPVVSSLRLGQLDPWLLIGVALGLWAARRQKWAISGFGVAVAALLKIIPGAILLYLLLRGKWQAVVSAAALALALFAVVLVVEPTDDLRHFFFETLPQASSSTLYAHNQSLPAWLARVFLPETNLASHSVTIGSFGLLALPLTLLGLALIWFVAGRNGLNPLALSLFLPVVLLASPITWNHYLCWMLLPLILMADARAWQRMKQAWRIAALGLLVVGLLLLTISGTVVEHTVLANPNGVASHWWWRLATGCGPVGVICWLMAGLIVLWYLRGYTEPIPVNTTQPLQTAHA